jgi:RNA polymerase sigma factor (sigma-70 family)
MGHGPLPDLVRRLRRWAAGAAPAGVTDGQLLDRFVLHRDEAAFAALLGRHGPLVWGTCRRVLGCAAAADDAFQAVFLVLVRRAAHLRRGGSLAGWLHEVARRTALQARTRTLRRRRYEAGAAAQAGTAAAPPAPTADLRAVLDEELARLPDRYRLPLVLCYLEGRTKAEAAALLGWPEGSVSGRLARGRDQLRQRLAGRGLALTAAVAVTAPPDALASVTGRLGLLAAAGCWAEVAAHVPEGYALMQGVMGMVSWSRWVLLAGGLLLTTGVLLTQVPGQEPARKAEPVAPKAAPQGLPAVLAGPVLDTAHLKDLAREKLDAAEMVWKARHSEFVAGRDSFETITQASQWLWESQRDLATGAAGRLKALEGHRDRLLEIEEISKVRYQGGRITIQDYQGIRYQRLEVDLWLELAKQGR